MTTDMQKAPSVARKVLNSPGSATPVARYDLSTSGGGRRYIADFFATELRRHDFAGYINAHLAADFACALAQHLAATGKQQVDAVRALPAEWRTRAGELDLGDEIGLTHHLKLKDCADELETALAAALPHLHPQPAELSFDVDAMLAACVPGGSIVDPQVVSDNIRAWVADRKPAELAEQQGYAPIDVTDPWRGLYQAARLPAPTEYGDIAHPDIPCWPDDREDALDKLVHAQGFDFQIVAGEFTEAALEEGDELYWAEMRAWTPVAPPEGEWRLAWKGDTEDGPYAWFVRPMALRPEPVALTATGKQQVGEVQGDARAQFEAWAKGEGWKDDEFERYSGGRCATAGEYHNSHLEALWYGWKSALAARQPRPGNYDQSAEDRFEQFVQAEIARSPGALRELGEYLGRVLDEDEFPQANSLLLQLATQYTAPPAQGIDLGPVAAMLRQARLYLQDGLNSQCMNKLDDLKTLIDQRDAAPGVAS